MPVKPEVIRMVRRLSDGKYLLLLWISGDGKEIMVAEEFPYWSPSGPVMKIHNEYYSSDMYDTSDDVLLCFIADRILP